MMAKQKLDRETRKAILSARNKIETLAKLDGNETETRKHVNHIFGTVLGYDIFNHISLEYAIAIAGDTLHCYISVQLDRKYASKPDLIV